MLAICDCIIDRFRSNKCCEATAFAGLFIEGKSPLYDAMMMLLQEL